MIEISRWPYHFDDPRLYPRKERKPKIYVLECLGAILLRVNDGVELVPNAPWVDKRIDEQDLIRVYRVPNNTPCDVLRAIITYVQARNISRWPLEDFEYVHIGSPYLHDSFMNLSDCVGCESGLVILQISS